MLNGVVRFKDAFFAVFTLERAYWALLYYVIVQGAMMAVIQFQVQIMGRDVVIGSNYSAKK